MAPTGRAAKVLKDKTGYGQIIHKTIYNFEKLITIENKENEEDHSFHYVFPIRHLNGNSRALIVDELSKISGKEAKNEFSNTPLGKRSHFRCTSYRLLVLLQAGRFLSIYIYRWSQVQCVVSFPNSPILQEYLQCQQRAR